MKIAHIGLSSYYCDGMTYQDNCLAEQNIRDGHTVLYVSNAAKFENGRDVDTGYEDVVLSCGVRLIRLPYVQLFGHVFSEKFRKVRGLYALLADFAPDVILCHSTQFWSVLDVIRYKKSHPAVKLYADTHTAYNNSGTNWLSLHILHGIYYKWLTKKAMPYLEQYFYISDECRQFSHEVYGIPNEQMEFYPLGGILPTEAEYARHRKARREELGVTDSDRLYVHSGKLDALKRTEELLKAFSAVKDDHATLAILGSIPEEMKPVLLPLIEADKRVKYLGWKTGAELQEYLCAADLYCQPGSVSATMQNSICCNCAVMSYPHEGYTKNLDYRNFLWVKTQKDMEQVFRSIAETPSQLEQLKINSRRCAEELLDYRKIAARLYR